MKNCNQCNKAKPADAFYAGRAVCIECVLESGRAYRKQNYLREWWYRDATGNKRPLPYGFTARLGSWWLKNREHYVVIIRAAIDSLTEERNKKAARLLRTHLRALPKHLPYDLHISGMEWPVIASALAKARQQDGNTPVKRAAQNLYYKLLTARREAELYEAQRTGKHATGRSSDVVTATERGD